jgi:hypothetical protein
VAALARHRVVQVVLLSTLLLLIVGPEIGRRLLVNLDATTSSALRHDLIQIAAFAFNMGVTLLVARHVFGPGRVTGHRVRGAVLLYLNIASVFGIVFTAILSHWPGALVMSGARRWAPILRAHGFADLFQPLDAHHHRLWRCGAGAALGAQSGQSGGGDGAIVPGDPVGADCRAASGA